MMHCTWPQNDKNELTHNDDFSSELLRFVQSVCKGIQGWRAEVCWLFLISDRTYFGETVMEICVWEMGMEICVCEMGMEINLGEKGMVPL